MLLHILAVAAAAAVLRLSVEMALLVAVLVAVLVGLHQVTVAEMPAAVAEAHRVWQALMAAMQEPPIHMAVVVVLVAAALPALA
jgi:hypothetical protein